MSAPLACIQALQAVMAEVTAVGKDSVNTDQGYKFRGIDATVNAVGPALRKHGVVVMPICESATYRDVRTSRDKPARECTVMVRYRFYGPAGDHIDAVVPGESMDFSDKGAAKAMSVAFRIALLQALCLPTDDPDPDSTTVERATAPPEPRQPTAWELATEARGRLSAVCKDRSWDTDQVAAMWAKTHPVPLGECTNAQEIDEFRKGMEMQEVSA